MATATTAKKTSKLDSATKRVVALNKTALTTSKKTGTATLDVYEAAIDKVAGYQKKAAAKSPVALVGSLVEKQADLLVTVGKKSTAPARYLLK